MDARKEIEKWILEHLGRLVSIGYEQPFCHAANVRTRMEACSSKKPCDQGDLQGF
jgi:hypothetical protein